MRAALVPPRSTALKLFFTGATVGPIVDSIHNQCLLAYDVSPISIPWASTPSSGIDMIGSATSAPAEAVTMADYPQFFFCSSWLIPPLLGIAYVVLGGVLPRVFEEFLISLGVETKRLVRYSGSTATGLPTPARPDVDGQLVHDSCQHGDQPSPQRLRSSAILAVLSTAAIIKLSEILQTRQGVGVPLVGEGWSDANFVLMLLAALAQWAALDGTAASLLAASVTSVGGPLSELPFVAAGCWHYLPDAADYFPLSGIPQGAGRVAEFLFGGNYHNLALSSITGPCYFAVTMDAIALGRWFDSAETEE